MNTETYLAVVIVVGFFSVMIAIAMCSGVKTDVTKEYKKSEFRKIPVAIVYDNVDAAKRMIQKLEPHPFDMVVHRTGLVETRSLMVQLIKAGDYNFHGRRLNFVYTTKEIADSEWFKTIISPMLTGGIGELCE